MLQNRILKNAIVFFFGDIAEQRGREALNIAFTEDANDAAAVYDRQMSEVGLAEGEDGIQ